MVSRIFPIFYMVVGAVVFWFLNDTFCSPPPSGNGNKVDTLYIEGGKTITIVDTVVPEWVFDSVSRISDSLDIVLRKYKRAITELLSLRVLLDSLVGGGYGTEPESTSQVYEYTDSILHIQHTLPDNYFSYTLLPSEIRITLAQFRDSVLLAEAYHYGKRYTVKIPLAIRVSAQPHPQKGLLSHLYVGLGYLRSYDTRSLSAGVGVSFGRFFLSGWVSSDLNTYIAGILRRWR